MNTENFNRCYEQFQEKIKTIQMVDDDALKKKIESFIMREDKSVKGNFIFHTIYQDNDKKYGLIYADYDEGAGFQEHNVDKVIKSDAKVLHDKLVQGKHDIDYLFIVPYFNCKDKFRGALMKTAVLSHQID